MKNKGWVGVDLDGTLAEHKLEWSGGIEAPVTHMVDRVKRWLAAGVDVRIVTARVHPDWDRDLQQSDMIQKWCLEHLGQRLVVTCMKDPNMLELWDDRAIAIVRNTGLTEMEHRMLNHSKQNLQGTVTTNGK